MDFAKISRTIIRFWVSNFQTGIYSHSNGGGLYKGFARLMLKGQQYAYCFWPAHASAAVATLIPFAMKFH